MSWEHERSGFDRESECDCDLDDLLKGIAMHIGVDVESVGVYDQNY